MKRPRLRRPPDINRVRDALVGQPKCPACRRPIIRGVDETRKYQGELYHRECLEYVRRKR